MHAAERGHGESRLGPARIRVPGTRVDADAETRPPATAAPASGEGSRDRALILHAIAQAGQAGPSDHPGVDQHHRVADLPSDYFPGYDVLGEIHRGGQGVVYRAVQRSTKRTVAVKLMHGGVSAGTSGRARFEREVEVLGQLSHPGIVNVHDSGVTADGGLFYVMDYIAGEPLDAIIRRWRQEADRVRRASDPSTSSSRTAARTSALGAGVLRNRLELFAKVCEGVQAAHVRGVIHRDLKPANVRLDQRGEPVVVDFGLAKLTGSSTGDRAGDQPVEMTATGQFIGSMPWSSPEQAEGAHASVDTRSDVYSLGVILYQIVTGGRFPYVVIGTMRQVMQNILHAEPERPSLIDRGVNDEVETILLKALAKERERRYQSAGELAADIRRYLAGEPIEAKRDSGWYVITKTMRRHRVPVAFAAALALVTVLFTVVLGVKYAEAETLRERAQTRAVAEANARTQAEIERARAEANFDAVRDLARTFMFDFHDEIEDLRGATRARGLVVEKAAEYLERLRTQVERDADPETGLLLELAAAYDRLADLQAASAEANMSDTDAAAQSLAEAEAVRDIVFGREPDNPDVLLGMARGALAAGRLEQRFGRYDDAVSSGRLALTYLDRAADLGAPFDETGPVRVDACVLVGDLLYRRARSIRESDGANARLDESLEWYGLAETAVRALADAGHADAAFLDAEIRYDRARALERRARLAVGDGVDGAGDAAAAALEHALDAVSAFERVRAETPDSRRAAHGLVTALRMEGIAWELVAAAEPPGSPERAQAADRSFEAADAAYRVALTMAMDPADLEAQRLLGVTMNVVGNGLSGQGRLDEAAVLYDELIAHRRGVYQSDPIARHLRDLFVSVGKRATVEKDLADAAADAGERVERLTESLTGYLEARSLLDELVTLGVGSDREIALTERAIAEIEDELSGLTGPGGP